MRLRILEVLATLKRAGAEQMAVSLACRLDRQVFDPGVISLYDAFPQGLEPELEACNVPVWHLAKRRGFDIRIYSRLRKVIADFRPDVIHTHSYVLRYTLPIARCAMVHTIHNIASRDADRVGRLINRMAFRRGVIAVAVADRVADSFRDTYHFAPVATIPNGIDTAKYRVSADARDGWRARHGFDRKAVLIVSVARLDPQKNPAGLVDAFENANVDAELLLVGEGAMRHQLTGRPHVHLIGVRSDIPEMLAACDVFALASNWEGHPVAIIEAMAAGLPVIATAVGGVPEIVGDAGVLIEPGDMEAFSAGIRSLVHDARAREELGAAARRRAARFDAASMVNAYAELFRAVCVGRSGDARVY